MARSKVDKAIARILATNKKRRTKTLNATKGPWRHRKKKKSKADDSPAEKARRQHELLERRKQKEELNMALEKIRGEMWEHAVSLREKFGSHTVEHYYKTIMQRTGKSIYTRAPSLWNAWQRGELGRRNNELPPDAPRLRVSDIQAELRVQWNAMTPAEKIEATKEYLVELETARDNKKFVQHNTEKAAHEDAQMTLASIQVQLEQLSLRTRVQVMLFAVRQATTQMTQPFIYASHPRLPHFVELTTKESVEAFAMRMDGYCISGVEGVIDDHRKQIGDLKAYLVELIRSKLDLLIIEKRLPPIPRIMYTNFDRNMTRNHHVEIRGWPLRVLCCPSDIKSRAEVELVVRGFETGTTYWKHLDGSEWDSWLSAYDSHANVPLDVNIPASATSNLNDSHPLTPPSMSSNALSESLSISSESAVPPASIVSSVPLTSIVSSTPPTSIASSMPPTAIALSAPPTILTSSAPPTAITSSASAPSSPLAPSLGLAVNTVAGSQFAAPIEPTAGDKRPAPTIVPTGSMEGSRKHARGAAAPFTTFLHYGVEGAPVGVKTTSRKPRKKSDRAASATASTQKKRTSAKAKDTRVSVIVSSADAVMSPAAQPSSSTV